MDGRRQVGRIDGGLDGGRVAVEPCGAGEFERGPAELLLIGLEVLAEHGGALGEDAQAFGPLDGVITGEGAVEGEIVTKQG